MKPEFPEIPLMNFSKLQVYFGNYFDLFPVSSMLANLPMDIYTIWK